MQQRCCRHAGVRRPSVRCLSSVGHTSFLRNRQANCQSLGKLPADYITRQSFFSLFLFLCFKILIQFQTSPLKVHKRSTTKSMHTPSEGLCQSFSKIVKFQILDFCQTFLAFINMGPYGSEYFKRYLL